MSPHPLQGMALTACATVAFFAAIPLLQARESAPDTTALVRTERLDPLRPLFIPTHPRVATTILFPGPIGNPEGRGFSEESQTGEYLISWQRGESHFSVTAKEGAGPANLNIPFADDIQVLYFYPVEEQFAALTSLRLLLRLEEPPEAAPCATQPEPLGASRPELPVLLGLMDKLRLLRAMPSAEARRAMAPKLGLELRELEAPTPVTGWWIHLAVRDPVRGLLGFRLCAAPGKTPKRSPEPITSGPFRLTTLLSEADGEPGSQVGESFVLCAQPEGRPLTVENGFLAASEPEEEATSGQGEVSRKGD